MIRRAMPAFLAVVAVVLGLGAAPPASAVSCGETLTASVTLDADLDCAGSALVVFGDDVVIDLAGHTIAGNTGNGIDNTLGFNRTVVRNGTIDGFENGIFHGGGEGHVIRNVRLDGGDSGIVLADAVRFAKVEKSTVLNTLGTLISVGGDDNRITKVVLLNSGGRGLLISGDRNIVVKSTVVGVGDGVLVTGAASGNVITANTFSANLARGIVVAITPTNTTVTKNRCEGNDEEGITITNAADTVVSGNTVLGNLDGIQVSGSARTLVSKNVVAASRDDGIQVSFDSVATIVAGNKTVRNRQNGILANSATTSVAKNTADGNAGGGIAAAPGAQDGGGNKARDNAGANCPAAFACK